MLIVSKKSTKEYGYFAEKTISVTLSGVGDGAAKSKKIMDKFRDNAPAQFNSTDIIKKLKTF